MLMLHCRGFETRNQAEQVTGYDIQEYGAQKRIECLAVVMPMLLLDVDNANRR